MECSDIKYYPFSINTLQILKESKSLYSYSETIENGMERLIECDTEKKWMTVKEKKKSGTTGNSFIEVLRLFKLKA